MDKNSWFYDKKNLWWKISVSFFSPNWMSFTWKTQKLVRKWKNLFSIINSFYHRIMNLERWNSKGRSGYSFDSIYKIYFAAFLHRSFEVIQIWLTHQSKALIFYFGMKKVLSPIFESFVGNRQTKFHILKFRVCVNTH